MLNPSYITAREKTDTYTGLLERLQKLERKFKVGDVDNENTDDSPEAYRFRDELDQLEVLVEEHKERLKAESPNWYFKFLAIASEAKGYFDTATPAFFLDRYHLAEELFRTLPRKLPPHAEAEAVVVKNKIRVIVAGLEYLHMVGNFGTAIAYAEDLRDYITNSGLATKENPAYGTRAIVFYFLGKSLRERGQDDDNQRAIECFYQCSEFYSDMARRRSNEEVDVVYARTRAMVSLAFGAGFLFHNSQSDLVRAKALIAQARLAFLTDKGSVRCKLHFYYLEQLYASILRAEVGDTTVLAQTDEEKSKQVANGDKLERARDILNKCEEELQHTPKYLIFVLLNQALLNIYSGPEKYPAARECINRLLDMCRDKPRLLANALVLKSHLERREHNLDTALDDAIRAYNQAANHPPVKIEALLAKGQAQMERKNFSFARADFEQSLQLNNNANPKLAATALLLLTELAIVEKKPREAYERFTEAKHIVPTMSHGYILQKYDRLEREVQDLQEDFVIRANETDLDYKKWEAKLQKWLVGRATREEPNLTHIAKRLNLSKKTVYIWLDKIKKQN